MILTAIWIILIILGLVCRKNNWVFYCQIIFTILLFGFSSGVADRQNYITYYNQVISNPSSVSGSNFIFKYFYYIFGQLGSFQFLVFITASIGILLFARIIQNNTSMVAFVYSLYMLSPFVIDVVQMRNFLAMAVLLNFMPYLIEYKGNKKDILMYLFGVFLAGCIHPSVFYLAILAIIPFLNVKKIRNITIIVVVATIALGSLSFVENLINITTVLFEKFNLSLLNTILQKYISYRYLYNTRSLMVRYILLIVAFIIICFIGHYVKMEEKNHPVEHDTNHDSVSVLIMKINWLTILVFPLITFSFEFYRMQRNVLLLVYIMSSKYLDTNILKSGDIRVNKAGIFIWNLALAILYLYIDVFLWNKSIVYDPLFSF